MVGAFFHIDSNAGVGLILRDSEGKVLMAVIKKDTDVMEPLEIELIAILKGFQLCIPLGLQSLCIEIDSLILVQELTRSKLSNSMYENVVEGIKQLKSILPCSIVHINRETNKSAHKLARFFKNVSDTNI